MPKNELSLSKVTWFLFTSIATCLIGANAFFVKSLVDKIDTHSTMIEQTNIVIAGLQVKVDDLREILKQRKSL